MSETKHASRVWVPPQVSGPFHSSAATPQIVSENSRRPERGRAILGCVCWALQRRASFSEGFWIWLQKKNNTVSGLKKHAAFKKKKKVRTHLIHQDDSYLGSLRLHSGPVPACEGLWDCERENSPLQGRGRIRPFGCREGSAWPSR